MISNLSFILDAPSHVCVVVIWLSDLESISIGDGGGGMEVWQNEFNLCFESSSFDDEISII